MGTGLSFVNDCDILRANLKESSSQLADSLKANKQETSFPEECGVQVIPIHWRQKLNVSIPGSEPQIDPETNEYEPGLTLGDIMPEGIPGIRMLISDVILDVLLYMTPKYRKEMINHVSVELNRVFKLFRDHNPHFTGSVSVYGHSLVWFSHRYWVDKPLRALLLRTILPRTKAPYPRQILDLKLQALTCLMCWEGRTS